MKFSYKGQLSPLGQISFRNKRVCFFCFSCDRIGLEDAGTLIRYCYPVLTLLTSHMCDLPTVPLPQKVELGLGFSLWSQVSASSSPRQCQALIGGGGAVVLQP